MKPLIEIPKPTRMAVWEHLLPAKQEVEQAVFLYVNTGERQWQVIEWEPILSEDFVIQTSFHIELTDALRARVIKRAHDFGASLVEIHSHLGKWPAQFSPSDKAGFQEWVPHVRWRLKGKPYGALVVTRSGFDGLAWIEETPVVLDIVTDGATHHATALSMKEPYEQSI